MSWNKKHDIHIKSTVADVDLMVSSKSLTLLIKSELQKSGSTCARNLDNKELNIIEGKF